MNTNKKKLFFFLLIIASLLVLGCQTTANNSSPEAKIIIDSLDREVALPTTTDRVISLAPGITEILYALNLEDKIVGTTDYCDYPEAAKSTPKMGGFENPNIELIVSSSPDIVFVSAGVQKDLIDKLEQLNLTVFCLDAKTVDQVIQNITLVGQIMQAEKEAQELTKNMKAKKARIEKLVANLEKPLVFFEVWDNPLMSAGKGTFIDSIINLAGGINLAGNIDTRYPQINMEVLLEKDPDVYIAIQHQREAAISQRPNYDSLKAIQHNRIYTIEDDLVTLPGPRITDGLEQMARCIHPELFAE